MTDVRSSRVFACIDRLHTLYSADIWTPHPVTTEKPTVYFAGIDGDDIPRESIIIVGVPEEAPAIEWASLNNVAMDEQFTLRVQIDTVVESLTQNDRGIDRQVFDRLAELVAIAETQLRNQFTGQPAGGFGLNEANNCGALFWRVSRVRPVFYLTDTGVGASCDLDIFFQTRI